MLEVTVHILKQKSYVALWKENYLRVVFQLIMHTVQVLMSPASEDHGNQRTYHTRNILFSRRLHHPCPASHISWPIGTMEARLFAVPRLVQNVAFLDHVTPRGA